MSEKKVSESIRAMRPAVAALCKVSRDVCSNADALKREARKTSLDSAVRRSTPPDLPRVTSDQAAKHLRETVFGPSVHSTREVRCEEPFADTPTVRAKRSMT